MLFLRFPVLVVFIVLWLTPFLAAAADRPVIESIEGDKIVVVVTPAGNKVGTKGTNIDFGDRIKTGPFASAKIRYPDGSKLLIGRATEMEVAQGSDDTRVNQLYSGEIRGIIKKVKLPGQGKKPPRFIVRSKTAVMGVRGTDFVYNLDEVANKAEIHTLDGVVDVAKDEKTLMEGLGTPVQKDQFISADEKQIELPQKFNREEYVKTLEESQPEFVALVKNDPEAVSYEQNNFEAAAPEPPRLKILMFQVGGMYAKQTGPQKGDVATTIVSWDPQLRIIGPIGLKAHVGAFPLKGKSGQRFNGVEGAAQIHLSLLSPLLFEVGVGAQKWLGGNAELGPLFLANLAIKLSDNGFINRLFVSLGHYERKIHYDWPGGTHQFKTSVDEVRLGLGFQL